MKCFKQTFLLRTCRKCNKHLTIDNFYKSKSARDGYDPVCKKCRSLIAKKGTVRYKREHPSQCVKDIIDKHNNLAIIKENIKIESDYINKNGYDEFIKNNKLKPKTTKPRTIPKRMCPACQKNKVKSKHHIIPRKYNGSDDKTNLIWLCYSCHNKIEIKTEEWIESGKIYNSDILRSMIINNGL